MSEHYAPEIVSSITNLLADVQPEVEVKPAADLPEDELDELDETGETTEESEESEEVGDEETEETEESEEDDSVLGEEYFEDTFVEINGEKVALGELKNGYLRQSDYTKKSQEVAAQRKEAEKAVTETESRAQEFVKQRFEMVALDVEKRLKDFQSINWTSLARSNPADYTALKAEYDVSLNEARQIEQEYLSIKSQQTAKASAQAEETAKATYAVLKEEIPGWGKELYTDILTHAVNAGMNQDVVTNIVDEAPLKLLYKAYMYDKQNGSLKNNVVKKDKPSVKSKLKPKAKVEVTKEEVSRNKTEKLRGKLHSTTNKTDRSKAEASLIANLLSEK